MNNVTIIDWDQIFKGDIPPLDFVFSNLLAGTVGGIIAPGGVGKSFLGLALCTALTTKDMLGLSITPADCKTTYITAEDPLIILQHRAFGLSQHLNPGERERAKKFITFQSIHGTSPCLLTNKGERNENWIDGLKRAATGQRLLIIDTLRKFHQGEENDSGHMTLLTQILDEIASQTGCAILFLHHASKATELAGDTGNQAASRGSSALTANIRFQLNLVNMTINEAVALGVQDNCRSKFVKLVDAKGNYGEKKDDHWLRRDHGGVLVKAVLDTPTVVQHAKKTKAAFNNKNNNNKDVIDSTDQDSINELSHKEIFG